MSVSSRAALVCAAIACCSVVASACGGGASKDTSTGSTTLTIYASMPLHGPAQRTSASIAAAEKLALHEAGGRVGAFTVKFKTLDDSKGATEGWDPDQTIANARIAAQDKSTIAYLGELDWEASAISIPLLSEVGILQVSPASTYTGLTRVGDKGEPEKYYPGGVRSFARVVPSDDVQAEAQVAYQVDEGCRSLYVISTRAVDAAALARDIAMLAPRRSIEIAGQVEADPNAKDYLELAKQVALSDADCAYVSWTGTDRDLQLLRDLNARAPALTLFLPALPTLGVVLDQLHAPVLRNLRITSPTLDATSYPPAGRRFWAAYERQFGTPPDRYAIFGYEAMKATLQAIRDAGERGNDRAAVIDAFFKLRDRDSVLGRYSIDKTGDTTLSRYGAYRVVGGEIVFDRVIETGD